MSRQRRGSAPFEERHPAGSPVHRSGGRRRFRACRCPAGGGAPGGLFSSSSWTWRPAGTLRLVQRPPGNTSCSPAKAPTGDEHQLQRAGDVLAVLFDVKGKRVARLVQQPHALLVSADVGRGDIAVEVECVLTTSSVVQPSGLKTTIGKLLAMGIRTRSAMLRSVSRRISPPRSRASCSYSILRSSPSRRPGRHDCGPWIRPASSRANRTHAAGNPHSPARN